jgi:hypothetical protein
MASVLHERLFVSHFAAIALAAESLAGHRAETSD